MSKSFRRYEILLPRRFNDQQSIPDELLIETLLELEKRFGAVSAETQTIRGRWQYEGQSFRDELVRVFVDVEDTSEARQFFVEYKERLKARFQQIDIWLTTYLIEPFELLAPPRLNTISSYRPHSRVVRRARSGGRCPATRRDDARRCAASNRRRAA